MFMAKEGQAVVRAQSDAANTSEFGDSPYFTLIIYVCTLHSNVASGVRVAVPLLSHRLLEMEDGKSSVHGRRAASAISTHRKSLNSNYWRGAVQRAAGLHWA